MIYCSLISSNLSLENKENVFLYSKNIEHENVIKLADEILPAELDFIFNVNDKFINNDDYIFLDTEDGKNYDKYLDFKENPKENMVFLQKNDFDVSRVFYNLKDRFNFNKKYGKISDSNFPLIIKVSFLKEIVNYIKLLINYDVFYNKVDSYIFIIGKIIND